MVRRQAETDRTTGGTTARRRHTGAAVTVAAALALGGALAGCSSSSSSATTTTSGSSGSTASTGSSTTGVDATALAASTVKAMEGLTSFRAAGTVLSSGERLTVDLIVTPNSFKGTFTTSKGSFQIITIGSTVYMEGDQAGWAGMGMPASMAPLLAGKWITGLPASTTSGLTGAFSTKQIFGSLGTSGAMTNVGTITVNGQQAVGLKGSDGSIGYVAATGTPYLLKAVSPNNGAQGSLTFSEFGTAPAPTAPANPVDLNSLAG